VDSANDFPRTRQGLGGLLSAALTDVRVERIEWTHRADPEDWWSGLVSGISTLGQIMESLTATEIARIRAADDRLSRAYLGDDGLLALPTTALLGGGVTPG
jgi:hypothetical protein